MKKSFLFVVLILFATSSLIAQRPRCLDEAILSIGKKDIIGAKRDIDKCFQGNESSADAWLVRANVLVHYYDYELDRKKRDPNYQIKMPDAIIVANESFYKALELNSAVKTDQGLLDPKEGQLITGDIIKILAADAMDNKNYSEAIKLLNVVIRSYRVDPKANTTYLGYAYSDLSYCYKMMEDNINYKKTLQDAAKLNVAMPDIFLSLYEIYKQEEDTVKCGEILTQARKVVPDSLSILIRAYELGYFAMIGDTAKLKNAALKMFEQNKSNINVINLVAEYLINSKEYLLAEEMINAGLEIAPNDFDLNHQMTGRYFFEAMDYEALKDEKVKLKKYMEATPLLEKAKEILRTALIWAEKAYNINQDDRKHNTIYSQILVRLDLLPIPEELQEKIDSYKQ